MLIASSDRILGMSRMRSTIALERRFRVHVIHRDGLLFDSRFNPSTRHGAGGMTLYIVIAGSLQVEGSAAMTGPLAVALAGHEFEQMTAGSATFRSWGSPNVTIELRLAEEDVRVPFGLSAGPLALGAQTWSQCRALAEASAVGAPLEDLLLQWLRHLCDDGIIDAGLITSVPELEAEPFTRLWSALRPLIERHATSASYLDLKRTTGLSMRQLGRDLMDFTRTFGLGEGFRDATHVLRLRSAILLLSAPTATAGMVAKEVGYRSLTAMGRAFRDAGLPSPSVVQEQLRSCG